MHDLSSGGRRKGPMFSTSHDTSTEFPARRSRWRALLGYAGLTVLGAAAALAGMGLVPAAEHSLGPVSVATRAQLGRPMTTLEVPPLGAISARTHQAPLAVSLAVTEIDPRALATLLSEAQNTVALVDQLTRAIEEAATGLAVRVLVGGAILGAVVLALLPGRRLPWIVAGIAGGLLGTGTLLTLTWRGFTPDAFREPAFTGSLERAPQLIRAIQEQNLTFTEARSRARGAAARLTRALALMGRPVGDPHSDTVAILHIGDIHSNPLGLEFARELAARFRVDAILDTGDLTSFGEPIEARIGELVAAMGVPYLFVAGNHDSQPIRDAIAALPNVVVLDGAVHDVGGVRIQGFADPAFTAAGEVSNEQHGRAVRSAARNVGSAVETQKPDVLAVHHPRLADAALGKVPLVLAGHRHRQASRRTRNTLLLEVGSSGATGLGSFLADIDLAYEAQILYFKDGRATAYDYVRFRGLGGDFQIQRRTLELQGPRSDSQGLPQQRPGDSPPPGSPEPGPALPERASPARRETSSPP